jgi:hypothetical protein
VVDASEDPLELGASAATAEDDEIAGIRIAEAFAVDEQRDTGREDRLADDVLPSPSQLDDYAIVQVRP